MECCRWAGDRFCSLRLPPRDSASADPGHRGDLPNTFGQLSSSNPTPIRRRLHLLRIGRWNSDGSIRAMILDLSDEQTRAPLNFLVETIEADRLLAGSATHDHNAIRVAPAPGTAAPGIEREAPIPDSARWRRNLIVRLL